MNFIGNDKNRLAGTNAITDDVVFLHTHQTSSQMAERIVLNVYEKNEEKKTHKKNEPLNAMLRRRRDKQKIDFFGVAISFIMLSRCVSFFFALALALLQQMCFNFGKFLCNGRVWFSSFRSLVFCLLLNILSVIGNADYTFRVSRCNENHMQNRFLSLLAIHESCHKRTSAKQQTTKLNQPDIKRLFFPHTIHLDIVHSSVTLILLAPSRSMVE